MVTFFRLFILSVLTFLSSVGCSFHPHRPLMEVYFEDYRQRKILFKNDQVFNKGHTIVFLNYPQPSLLKFMTSCEFKKELQKFKGQMMLKQKKIPIAAFVPVAPGFRKSFCKMFISVEDREGLKQELEFSFYFQSY